MAAGSAEPLLSPTSSHAVRCWHAGDPQPGPEVHAVLDNTLTFWEHCGGDYPWWCGYGVTWDYLLHRGPLLEAAIGNDAAVVGGV